jgi:hypothetical protein
MAARAAAMAAHLFGEGALKPISLGECKKNPGT